MVQGLRVVFRHWRSQRKRKPASRRVLKSSRPLAKLAGLYARIEDIKQLQRAVLSFPKARFDVQLATPVATVGVLRLMGDAAWKQRCMYWQPYQRGWRLLQLAEVCTTHDAIGWLWAAPPKQRIKLSAPARDGIVSMALYFRVQRWLEALRQDKDRKRRYPKLKRLYLRSNASPAVTAILLERLGRTVAWTDIANAIVGGNDRVLTQLVATQGSLSAGNVVRSRQLLRHMAVRRKDPRVLPAVRKAYEGTSSQAMRRDLLYTLYKIGQKADLRAVYPVFYSALQPTSPALHFNAILALKTQALREPDLRSIFRKALKNKKWLVVAHAADALSEYRHHAKAALKDLKAAYYKTPKARRSLLRAITRIAPKDRTMLPVYQHALLSKRESIVKTALLSVYRLKLTPQVAIPMLRKVMLSAFPGIRRRVLLILESYKAHAAPALPLLIKALKDPNLAVRTTAAGTFGEIGQGASSVAPLLLAVIRNARHRKMRQNALWSLLRIHPTPSQKRQGLLLGLRDKHPQLRYNALRSLSRADATTAAIHRQLKRMAKSEKHPQIRKVVAIRLKSLTPTTKPTTKPTSRPTTRPSKRR